MDDQARVPTSRLRTLTVGALSAVLIGGGLLTAGGAQAAEPQTRGGSVVRPVVMGLAAPRPGIVAPPRLDVPKPTPKPAPKPPAKPPAPALTEKAAYEAEVLRLVNVQRAAARLRPVALDSCAKSFAARQTAVILTRSALSHQVLRPVLSACRARSVGENVAYGNVTPARLMQMWMASPGHRANILKPTYTHLGVSASKTGAGRWYATQVFLTR